jgi:hypothetical protein
MSLLRSINFQEGVLNAAARASMAPVPETESKRSTISPRLDLEQHISRG